MKVLVSACLLGENCKYNGKNNYNEAVAAFLRDKEVIPVCPEMLLNLPIPRPCAEIADGVVIDENGKNVDAQYRRAVSQALESIRGEEIDLVILQSRSPTCGKNRIYDGTFTGRLIPGSGLFAKALLDMGYVVMDAEDFR